MLVGVIPLGFGYSNPCVAVAMGGPEGAGADVAHGCVIAVGPNTLDNLHFCNDPRLLKPAEPQPAFTATHAKSNTPEGLGPRLAHL